MSSLKKYLSFQHICTILTFQSVAKAAFSCLQSIKVTFLILHHFPVLLLPLCLPVVLCREPARPRSAEDPEDLSPFWHGATELGSHVDFFLGQNLLKNDISIHTLCPQSGLKHSVVHFQGIRMKVLYF